MNAIIKINYNDDNVYCTYSKEKIEIGEKYIIIFEEIYNKEIIDKPYKLEYAPIEEDEPYICGE